MASFSKIGFLGAGNMASALLRGLHGTGADPQGLGVTDIDRSRSDALAQALGVQVFDDAASLVAWAEVVVLAVKPQVASALLSDLSGALTPGHLLISIAAGLSCAPLAEPLRGVRVVRVMPNTPSLVGQGASALCAGPGATSKDLETARAIFGSVGRVVEVKEASMDAVTGLSGSGPAYVFVAIEALADAGVREGLARDVAVLLAAQTVFGAAKLVLESGKHPGQLKDQVTSPGGTTIAGVAALEENGLRHALMSAVQASAARSRQMSEDK